MLIRLGYDIQFDIPLEVPIVALLHVHPSRFADLREPDQLRIEPSVPAQYYHDTFGNMCSRFLAPQGHLRLFNSTVIQDSGQTDPVAPNARQVPVQYLPHEVLRFLLASRYCESDCFMDIAGNLFGQTAPGWARVQAICDWVHANVTFGYHFASPTRTARDVYQDRTGVCRDFSIWRSLSADV